MLALVVAGACGGSGGPPPRAVIENDVGDWRFRRYQKLLDVEVWVKANRAVAHTASYASFAAEKRGKLADSDVVNAFVTRYRQSQGVRKSLVTFARRLAGESGYQVEEKVQAGVRLFAIRGAGELWAMWSSVKHVVKLGGRGVAEVPEDLIKAYGERYPSTLVEGELENASESVEVPAPEPEPFDPSDPKPEW